MFRELFLTLLLFSGVKNTCGISYPIDEHSQADFYLQFESHRDNQSQNHNLRFPNAYSTSPALISSYGNFTECLSNCATDTNCVGVFNQYQEPEFCVLENFTCNPNSNISNWCYSLSNLGLGYEFTNTSSESYVKVVHHDYSQKLGDNTIEFYVWETEPENVHGNSTVYLDDNHNGVLDEGERFMSVQANGYYTFENVPTGIHLVRIIPPDFCHPLYPGLKGEEPEFNILGDGYIDTVKNYYHHGHSKFSSPHGGYVNGTDDIIDNDFSFLLGNDNTTYLSFYPGYNITLGFVDETVTRDLYVDTTGDSTTWAHVYVGNNYRDFKLVGIVNSTHHHFNLTEQGFSQPIVFVRLHFQGDNQDDDLRITGIHAPQEDLYGPSFGYLVGVPNINSRIFPFFFNDCYQEFYCEDYCFYMSDTYDREESCYTGCQIYYETTNCHCDKYENISYVDFYGNNFIYEWCERGCHYEMAYAVAPEFFLLRDTTGYSPEPLQIANNCSDYCLMDMYFNCVDNDNCTSFSLHTDTQGELYDNLMCQRSPEDIYFIKKEFYENLTEYTTTTTTSSQTETSSTQTETSSTQTETSSTQTETSSTQTETSSTQTETSSTQTETSSTQTETSSSQTETSSTQTITNLTDNHNYSTSSPLPNNNRSIPGATLSPSKDDDSNRRLTGILVAIFLLLIIGFSVLGIVLYRRKMVRPEINPRQAGRQILGFDNPIYNQQLELGEPDVQYQDVEPTHLATFESENIPDGNNEYLDIQS